MRLRRILDSILIVALIGALLAVAGAAVSFLTPEAEAQNTGAPVQIRGFNPDTGRNDPAAVDQYGGLFTRGLDHPNRFTAHLDNIGATLTELQAAPAAGSLYLVTVTGGSTTATAGQFLLRQGTGTNCGTNTATLFPGTTTTARVPAPANTAAPTTIRFAPPIKLTALRALCLLGVATNTTWAVATGFTAP